MAKKRKPYQEPLKASLCRGRLLMTSDAQWFTNREWMVRVRHCKVIKSTPELSGHQPDPSNLRFPDPDRYQAAVVETSLTLQGLYPVMVGDEIATWIDAQYAEAWDRGLAHVAGPLDPILFGGQTLADSYAVVMPAQVLQDKTKAQQLRRWLAKVK